jgi:hypothetical protein
VPLAEPPSQIVVINGMVKKNADLFTPTPRTKRTSETSVTTSLAAHRGRLPDGPFLRCQSIKPISARATTSAPPPVGFSEVVVWGSRRSPTELAPRELLV